MQWAMLTETLGYHFLMTSDHLAITPDVQERSPAPFYEPFTTLGWLAGVTRRIEIGTTVIVLPYRNPVEVARMAANVDQLSGGRLLFGVGVGWAEQEFAVLDVPFHQRGARTDEYLAGHQDALDARCGVIRRAPCDVRGRPHRDTASPDATPANLGGGSQRCGLASGDPLRGCLAPDSHPY